MTLSHRPIPSTVLPILVAGLVALACGDEGPQVPAAIVLTPNVVRVPSGESRQLTATVVDGDGRAVPDVAVGFVSSETAIFTVSEAGLLTAAGPVGTATISASAGAVEASIEAEAVLPASSLVVVPASLTMAADSGTRLSITVTDENGNSIPDAPFLLQIDQPSVAQIVDDGEVFALQAGTATITVTSGELRREIPVTVTPAEAP
jgi:uncharacterized protein YjdB